MSNSSLYNSCFVGVIWRPELKKNIVLNTMIQKSSFILLLTPQTLYQRVWSSRMQGQCTLCLPKQGSGKVLNSHYQTGSTVMWIFPTSWHNFLFDSKFSSTPQWWWLFFILMTYLLETLDIARRLKYYWCKLFIAIILKTCLWNSYILLDLMAPCFDFQAWLKSFSSTWSQIILDWTRNQFFCPKYSRKVWKAFSKEYM